MLRHGNGVIGVTRRKRFESGARVYGAHFWFCRCAVDSRSESTNSRATLSQIIALDSEPVRDEAGEYFLIHKHFRRLQGNRFFRESKVWFVPENNLAMEAAHLDSMVRDIPGVNVFWEKESKAGVCKTEATTRDYQFLLQTALAADSLKFDEDLWTVTREKTPQCMLDMLQEQMLRLHWASKRATDEMGTDKHKLTGKIGTKNDDLSIAVQMLLYWARIIIAKENRVQ